MRGDPKSFFSSSFSQKRVMVMAVSYSAASTCSFAMRPFHSASFSGGMEEYEKCEEIVSELVEEYQIYAAFATSMEARKTLPS